MTILNFKIGLATRLMLTVILLLLNTVVRAQIIDDDYVKIGEIKGKVGFQNRLPFGFFPNAEQDVVLIAYDFKPAKFVAYRLSDWSVLSYFETSGHVSNRSTYFDKNDEDIIYIKRSGGKTVFKANYNTGVVQKLKCKDAPNGCGFYENKEKEYMSFWEYNYRSFYFFYKDYVILHDRENVSLYKRLKP